MMGVHALTGITIQKSNPRKQSQVQDDLKSIKRSLIKAPSETQEEKAHRK